MLLTCDFVFSGGEVFALAIKQLPHVTIIGDHINGIFSYQLEKKLPNHWRYCLSYQKYLSADMTCYEGKGVPADIELLNRKTDIEDGVDPLIVRAIKVLKSKNLKRRLIVRARLFLDLLRSRRGQLTRPELGRQLLNEFKADKRDGVKFQRVPADEA